MRRRVVGVVVCVALLSGLAAVQRGSSAAGATSVIQPDAEVVFDSGGVPIHASFRAPAVGVAGSAGVPAALIIGGSGNIDRNGNGPALPVDLNPYAWVADQLSAQGVASIRYDKLGTGTTGLGPYAADPSVLLGKSYDELRVQPARDALAFLARQPGVDPTRLIVVGHSEGGMVALELDTHPGTGPRPAGLALVEPQYARILDIISRQLSEVATELVQQGKVDAGDAAVLVEWLNAGVAEVRTGTPPYPEPGPDPLPGATGATAALQAGIRASIYSSDPTLAVQTQAMRTRFGQDDDRIDPLTLAPTVSVPVLVTCGTRDTETPCATGGPPGSGVVALASAFPPNIAQLVVAPGTVHFLRNVGDDNPTPTELINYPYSVEIQAALTAFAATFVAPRPTTTTTAPSAPLPVTPQPVVVTPSFAG